MTSGPKHKTGRYKTKQSGKWKVQNPAQRQSNSNTHTNSVAKQNSSESWIRALLDILSVIFGSRKLSKHCILPFILSLPYRTAFTDSLIHRINKSCENVAVFVDKMWKTPFTIPPLWDLNKDLAQHQKKCFSWANGKWYCFYCMGTDDYNYFPFYSGY